jgi:hypothetical protein
MNQKNMEIPIARIRKNGQYEKFSEIQQKCQLVLPVRAVFFKKMVQMLTPIDGPSRRPA